MTGSAAYSAGFDQGKADAAEADLVNGSTFDDYDEIYENVDVPAEFARQDESERTKNGVSYIVADYARGHENGWQAHFESQMEISIRASHVSSDDAYSDVQTITAGERSEISHATAVTIASWWQSPGAVGSALAGLASGATVFAVDVLADIEATRMTSSDIEPRDLDALAALQRHVINYAGSLINRD